jgi:ribosomal protein L37AE/L43A
LCREDDTEQAKSRSSFITFFRTQEVVNIAHQLVSIADKPSVRIMMPFLHTRSKCDACDASVATIERNGCWLCSSCDTTFSEFLAPSATPSDVNAAVSAHPAPGETAATLSRDCASLSPASPRAAGMSRVEANSGGEHEAVTQCPCNIDDRPTANDETSLSADAANVDEERSGTAPAVCGTEHERVGAANSKSGACEGTGSNADGSKTADGSARYSSCGGVEGHALSFTLAPQPSGVADVMVLRAGIESGPQDSISDPTLPPPQATSETSVNCGEASVSSLSSSRIPGDWDRQAVAEASTPDLKLSAAVDPGACGFDFEADLAILESQWALDGIIMNSRTFAASVINESISQSSE